MSQATQPQKQSASTGNPSKLITLDWPALALFFLLATAFWIPPLPQSMWSLPAVLRVTWLTVLLVSSYIVLFRRRGKQQ